VSLKEEVELLQRIPLFQNVEAPKLKLLAFTSERVAFEAGHVLFNEGDMGDAAYIIMDGEAEVLVASPAGPVLVAVLKRNAFLGEIAIMCDVPRTATVRARSRLVCLRISKELFLRLMNEFPQMAVAVVRELAHRLELSNHKLRTTVAEMERLRQGAAAAPAGPPAA
jgi:CRP/FNR family transcriptional regulator, cyclic AMP receptor protein